MRGEDPSLTEDLHPPVFVPESLTGIELLENFKHSGINLAFVIDEYGEVQGIVTLKDVMEAIAGEFKPRRPEDAWAVRRDDGSWLLDGFIPVPELKDRLDLKEVPEEERGRYNTLSGMVMLLVGRLPQTADRCEWEGWSFEVMDMDGKRIDKVLATPIAPPLAIPLNRMSLEGRKQEGKSKGGVKGGDFNGTDAKSSQFAKIRPQGRPDNISREPRAGRRLPCFRNE